ncbi:hypothetical protein V8F33_013903 [Rhypophila sp. PSN 637]
MADSGPLGRRKGPRNKRPIKYNEDLSPELLPYEPDPVSPPLPSLLNTVQENQFKDPQARRRSRSRGRGQPPTPGNPPRPSYGFDPPQFESEEAQFAAMNNLQGEFRFGRRALEPPGQNLFSSVYVPEEFEDGDFKREVHVETVNGELVARVTENDGPAQYYNVGPDGTLLGRRRKSSIGRKMSKRAFEVPDDSDHDSDELYAQPGPSKPQNQTIQAYMNRPKDQTFQKHLKDSKDQTIQNYYKRTEPNKNWLPNWLHGPEVEKMSTSNLGLFGFTKPSASKKRAGEKAQGESKPTTTRTVRRRSSSSPRAFRGWLAPFRDLHEYLTAWLPWWWLRVPAALYLLDKWVWNAYLVVDPFKDQFSDEPNYLVLGVNTLLITLLLRVDRPFLWLVGTVLGWVSAASGVFRRWVLGPGFRNEQRRESRKNRRVLARYSVPLLIASWDLANWLYDILEDKAYSPRRCKAYGDAWGSQFTFYLFGQYFAGVHIVREMTQFFSHIKGGRAEQLKTLIWKIQDEFITVHYEMREELEMRWFEGHILAVQEAMTVACDGGDGLRTMGWVEFQKNYEKSEGHDSMELKKNFERCEDGFQRIVYRRFKHLYSTQWKTHENPQGPEKMKQWLEDDDEALEKLEEEEKRIAEEKEEDPENRIVVVIPDHRVRRLQHLLSDIVKLLDEESNMEFNRPVRRCEMVVDRRVVAHGTLPATSKALTYRVPCDCSRCNSEDVDFKHCDLPPIKRVYGFGRKATISHDQPQTPEVHESRFMGKTQEGGHQC